MASGCLPQRVFVPFVLGVSVQKTPCHPEAIALARPIQAMLKTRKIGFDSRPPRPFF